MLVLPIFFISFQVTETIFTGTRTRDSFRVCDLCSCNLLVETTNFGLGAVLISCLVSELQKPSSPGLGLWTLFRSFELSKIPSWFRGFLVYPFSSYKRYIPTTSIFMCYKKAGPCQNSNCKNI
jgi:hypothetical protein